MQVHVAERRHDESIVEVIEFVYSPIGGHFLPNIGNDAVFEGDIAVFDDFEFAEFWRMDDIAAENLDHGFAPFCDDG